MVLAIQKLCNHVMLMLGVPGAGAFSQNEVESHQTLLQLYTFCPSPVLCRVVVWPV